MLAIIGAGGVILTAGYLLWTIQRVYLGPLNEKYKSLPRLTAGRCSLWYRWEPS